MAKHTLLKEVDTLGLIDELVENDSSTIYKVPEDPLKFLIDNWSVKGKIDRMPYSLNGHCYQEGILQDTANEVVVMKSGQMGISEIMLGLATHFAITKGNVVYLFPTSTHIGEFVQGRFNPVIDYSDFLDSIVGKGEISSDMRKGRKKDAADKVSIKKIGNHFMYLRGSQNARQLKSVDGDLLVLDEYDEMVQDNIPLAKSRIDHSPYKWIRSLSTPTYPDYGIHSAFLAGDQRYYFLKCEHCGEWQALTWEDNINPDISTEHRLCRKCRKPIDHTQKGEWVPTFRDRDVHSYHISQLYSSAISVKFLLDFQKNPKNEEEFYKSKLGLPFTPKGGSLTRDEVFACMGDYKTYYSPDEGVCTMGVDIGRKIHYQISRFFGNKKKVLRADTVDEFEELDTLMKKYDIAVCVVDANPEYKKARDFALRFRGRIYLAYYPNMKDSDYYIIGEGKHGELTVNINRTLSLDYTFDRFRCREIILPRDIRDDGHEGYIEQVMAPCKIKQFDKKGNQFYTYLEGAKADHFAHAANYDEVASAILGNKEYRKYCVDENFKGGKVMSKLKEIFDKF
jgi:hypothetical protein